MVGSFDIVQGAALADDVRLELVRDFPNMLFHVFVRGSGVYGEVLARVEYGGRGVVNGARWG
ncbi:hypothetical protein ACFVYG_09255 [Streptomyces sp. NPDC058256]|uniref:hypothetical protein n=1 Tax=Streptomyces sp. NPDC058256 TaxID=3346408 RepID=UPI0036F07110